ncbi:hypothetical protein Gohar_020950 [Gossypium harknessii]|uniref:BHLH domain-containing protein n=2 Tax=Gossypium TaxID=3633 RepID=A0A7J9HZY3_9ROSI|nr:hypothetical protein [Gossypium harknessii]
MDRATVLGDAVKYMKQLQEKVKTLEEQARQKPKEYVACVKKHQLLTDSNGDFSSWDEHFSAPFDEPLPEIEARFINSNAMTFGSCALHITIVAQYPFFLLQMDMEFCMTIKEIVKKLRLAFIFLV